MNQNLLNQELENQMNIITQMNQNAIRMYLNQVLASQINILNDMYPNESESNQNLIESKTREPKQTL